MGAEQETVDAEGFSEEVVPDLGFAERVSPGWMQQVSLAEEPRSRASRRRGCVWSLQRCTAGSCVCTAENIWILFTRSQRKSPGSQEEELMNALLSSYNTAECNQRLLSFIIYQGEQDSDSAWKELQEGEATPPSSLTWTGGPKGHLRDPAAAIMSSTDLFYCSESETVFKVVVEHSQVTQQKLKVVLRYTKKFVATTSLPREEAKVLHEYLNSLKTNMSGKDLCTLQQDQLDRKTFLEEFPEMKQDLEEDTEKIRAFADKVDKVHKDCTISKVVAHSTGAVSGILSIVGLALAPLTMGATLPLLATGLGLGIASTVTSVSTSIVEHVNTSSAETKTIQLLSRDRKKWKVIEDILLNRKLQIISATRSFISVLQTIEKNFQLIRVIEGSPALAAKVKFFITNGKTFIHGSVQVPKTFGGMASTMAKGVRITGIVMSCIGLVIDVGFLVKESIHLHDGAKTESAEKLRQRAQELESILELLTEIHENPAGGLDSLNPRGLQGPGTFAECLRGRLLEGKRRGESIDGAGC